MEYEVLEWNQQLAMQTCAEAAGTASQLGTQMGQGKWMPMES